MKSPRPFHQAAVGPRQLAPGERRPPLRLRAAVEQILAARAARPAGKHPKRMMRGAAQPASRTLRRLAQPRCLSFTVRDRCLHAGELPTAELLDAALALLTGGEHQPGDRRRENWFFGVAVQAVATALAHAGRVLLPIGVRFQAKPGADCHEPPPLPASSRVKARAPGEGLHLVLRLEDPVLNPAGAPSLAALLDAAFLVFDGGYHQPGRWHNHPWFFRQALREVCLVVLKEGGLPWPLHLRLDPPVVASIHPRASARTAPTPPR